MTTKYDPDDTYTAGTTLIAILPAVASKAGAKLIEVNAGYEIQCAIEELGMTTNANTQTRKKICNKVGTQSPGEKTYEASDTVLVAENPQDESALMDLLVEDAIVWIAVRPGMADDVAPAAAQKIWLDKRQVLSVDPEPITTESGNTYQWRVKWLVKDRNLKATILA